MSALVDNMPDPTDRLALLLDHAEAMGMALTCEDFETINERTKSNYYHALLGVLTDAQQAMKDLLTQKGVRA